MLTLPLVLSYLAGSRKETEQMPDLTTTSTTSKADAGRLGGRVAAQRMTAEARQERGRRGAVAGIATRVEKNWGDLSDTDRDRIRAVALASN